MITNWFHETYDKNEILKTSRIFLDLNEWDTEIVMRNAKQNKQTIYHTLNDFAVKDNRFLNKFYFVIDNMPCWLSQDILHSYNADDLIIENRFHVKHVLQEFFEKFYYAVIMLYVMEHYDVIFESSGNIIKIEDVEYEQRFSKDVWYRLTRRIYVNWDSSSVFDKYKRFVEKLSSKKQIQVFLFIIEKI